MKYVDLTLPTPPENLACDEALLDWCEEGHEEEILRFWEPQNPFVVVGYANKVASEVNLAACRALNVPVLRRCSGGGTVLQGPGCLNYSLILKIQEAGPLHSITETNRFILQRHREALSKLTGQAIELLGTTDLAIGKRKFSGNSQRRKRQCLLFHGTFLLQFDIPLVEKFLAMPSKQPDYRQNRTHADFLINLHVSPDAVKSALRRIWCATEPLENIPSDKIANLMQQKYSTDEWNFKF
ncbi:MAG: lipoate--protein ligase family protein [Verrucomicrobia bacterium]|nr:lipoate--protein ligase family protein [Verrucomicrobiota bacterium]